MTRHTAQCTCACVCNMHTVVGRDKATYAWTHTGMHHSMHHEHGMQHGMQHDNLSAVNV